MPLNTFLNGIGLQVLLLADGGLGVVAGHVVHPDAVAVEVVEHGHAGLVALTVVGLGTAGTRSRGEGNR